MEQNIERMKMVSSSNPTHFNQYINDAVKEGFVPYGEFKVVQDRKAVGIHDRFLYSQMMVKYKEA